jgi:hypothetical protein
MTTYNALQDMEELMLEGTRSNRNELCVKEHIFNLKTSSQEMIHIESSL